MSATNAHNFEADVAFDWNLESVKEVNKLSSSFTFWHVKRVQGPRTQENYERNIKRIGSFESVRADDR